MFELDSKAPTSIGRPIRRKERIAQSRVRHRESISLKARSTEAITRVPMNRDAFEELEIPPEIPPSMNVPSPANKSPAKGHAPSWTDKDVESIFRESSFPAQRPSLQDPGTLRAERSTSSGSGGSGGGRNGGGTHEGGGGSGDSGESEKMKRSFDLSIGLKHIGQERQGGNNGRQEVVGGAPQGLAQGHGNGEGEGGVEAGRGGGGGGE